MSASSSTTAVNSLAEGHHVDILEKILSQRALGEYSPASTPSNSRPASHIGNLEKGEDAEQAPQPTGHRPTGFKVRKM